MGVCAGDDLALTDPGVTRWRRRLLVTDACAVWLGAIGRDGYGRFSYRCDGAERTVTPHEVAAWLAAWRGDGLALVAGSTVLQDCGVRLCCATGPGHVRVATQSEIVQRAPRRGRSAAPGRGDVRGPLGLSRAIQAGLRSERDQSRAGLARALAEIVAAGDLRGAQLDLFATSTAGAMSAAART